MLRLIRNLIIILAVIIGLAFGFFNYGPTPVDLLWTTAEAPLSVMLGLAFLLGLVIALIFCSVRIVRLRSRLSSARHQIRDTEARLSNQRSTAPHDA